MTNERYPGELKDDAGKAPMHLLPWGALAEAAFVMGFGAEKYAPESWRHLTRSRQFGATMRHLSAWWRREDRDPETGRSHLVHAATCLLEMAEQELDGQGRDDRPPR